MPKRKKVEPHKIGRYEIRRELGRGVMGVVCQAWDPALGRTIALKTIMPLAASKAERETWESRFLTEARAAARLSHPAIVVIHDVGRDEMTGILYIALEYLEGETLAEKLGSGRPLPWQEALRVVARVAHALHHAHAQGVVHRDVKPANIMILRTGEPKILDFGVARLDAGALTSPGDLCGTPLYMSPEQAAGHPLDARSDLFSLGVVAWSLLTGRSPFAAASVPAILARVMHRNPPPPSELVPGIPSSVDAIIARAMAKAPENRYPDGRSFAEDLEDALAARVPRHRGEWQPPHVGERTLPSGRRAEAELPALDVGGDSPLSDKPARERGWPRLMLLLALLASAGAYFYGHPEHRWFWAAHARRLALQVGSASPRHDRPSMGNTPSLDAGGRLDAAPLALSASAYSSPPIALLEPTPAFARPAQLAVEPVVEEIRDVPGPPPPEPVPAAPAASPSPPPAPSPPPRATKTPAAAYLSIGFEHGLPDGMLEVWVDGTRVAREKLDSRLRKKLLVFDVRKGSVQQTLRLSAGRHRLEVRVRSNGETKTAHSTKHFPAGATRRLELRISRLSGKLALEWK